MAQTEFSGSFWNSISFIIFEARLVCKERADLINKHTVFMSLWTKVCKTTHASAKASCSVEKNNCITVVHRMEYGCLVNEVGDVKSVNQKVSNSVVLEELKPHAFCSNLFVLSYNIIISLCKFFFELGSGIRMKAKLLCKILEIENTAYIVSFSHVWIYSKAVFKINLVQLF